jgi:putative hemolysin
LNGSGLLVLKILGIHQTGHRHIHSPEELELLIAESRDGGLLEPDEHRRLQQALRLRLRTAGELMVPWAEVEAIDLQSRLSDVLDSLSQSSYTRVPVYRGARDIVAGILNTKKLALRMLQGSLPQSITELLQPAVTTSTSATGDRLLALFQARKTHHAIVIDEAGRAVGLVTLEDVLRALLGVMPDDVQTRTAGPVEAAAGARGGTHG